MLVDLRNQFNSAHPMFAFSNEFLQSIGNIQFLQNARLLAFFWPIAWFSDLRIAKVAVYLVIAIIVFLSAYCVARLLSQDRVTALTAAWILGVLTTPFVPMPFFYPILSVSPTTVTLIASPVVALWAMKEVGRSSVLVDVRSGLILAGFGFYLLAALPLSLSLVGPGTVVYLVLALLLARRRSELIRKIAVLGAVLILAIGLRWPWYIYGLLADSAPYLFPNDFTVVYHDPIFVSILFHGPTFGWAGPILVESSAIGALLCVRRATAELRAAACTLLAIIIALASMGVALFAIPHWIMPPPIYFEMAAWPLYGLFGAVALHRLSGLVTARFSRTKRRGGGRSGAEWVVPLPAVLVTMLLVMTHPPTALGYPFPPRHPAVVDFLRANIATTAHSGFNGRVATIVPVKQDAEEPWTQQFTTGLGLAQTIGNDEMSLGLWYYQIPTLFEYNQLTSPAFHALVKRALQRPSINHERNVVILSYPDARVLRLLGVRYVILPQAGSSIGELRARENVTGQNWGLFELSAPNLATYSPTSFEVRRDLASSIDFILDDRVDLTKRAVVQQDIVGAFLPLQSSSLSMADGSLHVVAQSAGRSLVVVPLEFSHCTELHDLHAGTGAIRTDAVRVDADLTGIVFEHNLDAVLTFRSGPLNHPLCRWQDYQELKALLR